MRLNEDLSFAYVSKAWIEIRIKKRGHSTTPFVCAISKNSLLIYGEKKVLIFNKDNEKFQRFFNRKNQKYYNLGHGFLTRKGVAVGIVYKGPTPSLVKFNKETNCLE